MLELRIPPLLVTVLCMAVSWFVSRIDPFSLRAMPFRGAIAGAVLLAGVAICSAGVFSFKRANTTLSPFAPGGASSLIVSGAYAVTRNPMYLGLLLVLLAWCIQLATLLGLVMLPVFVGYMNRFQILPEERVLESLFGAPYQAYRSRVRRWF